MQKTHTQTCYMRLREVHMAPVMVLGYNATINCVISDDLRGHSEYWSAEAYKFPTSSALTPGAASVECKFKRETDLHELAKCKTYATSIDMCAFVVARIHLSQPLDLAPQTVGLVLRFDLTIGETKSETGSTYELLKNLPMNPPR
ncbi:hypothetical protein FI667_g2628, partial [Globisporangium splendens]